MKQLFLCACCTLFCVEAFTQAPASKDAELKGSAALNSEKLQDISNDTTTDSRRSNAFISEFAAKKYSELVRPVVTNVAGLRSLTKLSAANNYQTTDYGGGSWYYDADDPQSEDNTGTVLVSGSKRFKRIYSGAMDIKWFGSLATAIAAIGANASELLISNTQILTGNVAIPANITIEIQKGGGINLSGFKLTIDGTFKAGRYQVFSGRGIVNFGSGAVDAQFPEWDGATSNNTNSDATTKAFALQYARALPISLGAGTYLLDSIAATGTIPLIITGQLQRGISKIQLTPSAKIGISIGMRSAVYRSILKDFTLLGTSHNAGGLILGGFAAMKIAAWVKLENLEIRNFTGAGAYGICLQSVQELQVHNCILQNNYNNVYRPASGYCTSTLFDGKDSHIGYATNRGVDIEALNADVTFRDVIIERNTKEGIYCKGVSGSIFISGCFFEANNTGGGTGSISIHGDPKHKPTVKIVGNVLYELAGPVASIFMSQIASGLVSQNTIAAHGLKMGQGVNCVFRDNAGINGQSMLAAYTRMRDSSALITAEDIDLNGSYFHVGDINFRNKVIINPISEGGIGDSLISIKNGVLKRVFRPVNFPEITPNGKTGNQTINKATGTVNMPASGTSITVTNNLVTASSIVTAVIRSNDTTAYIKNVAVFPGRFVINLGAAATAETSIGFVVN
jgi:hypothetical protein